MMPDGGSSLDAGLPSDGNDGGLTEPDDDVESLAAAAVTAAPDDVNISKSSFKWSGCCCCCSLPLSSISPSVNTGEQRENCGGE